MILYFLDFFDFFDFFDFLDFIDFFGWCPVSTALIHTMGVAITRVAMRNCPHTHT